MHDMTAFQRDVLFIIQSQDEPNGLEIKSAIDEYYQQDINHGRLYPNLDQLVEMGFVVKGEYDKRTNKYELTRRGKEELKHRHEWEQKHIKDIIQQPAEFEI